jgi:hypothetical protein
MATVQAKLDLLQEVMAEDENLSRVIDKLLKVFLEQHQARLDRYSAELEQFETRYGMSSAEFYQKFEHGQLGDAIDFFEWAGLFELQQELLKKVERLETAQ